MSSNKQPNHQHDIETLILQNLHFNEEYTRTVIPFLKEEYFTDSTTKNFFSLVSEYFGKYNALPTKEVMDIEIANKAKSESVYKEMNALEDMLVESFSETNSVTSQKWLIDETEKFCKDRALFLALAEAAAIAGGQSDSLSTTAIPDILNSALGVSFDVNIGHDYVQDMDIRFEFYKNKIERIPFRLQTLNKITNGGFARKTLNCFAAGTGVGKSMLLCDLAASYVLDGKKVLYITMEMEEKLIGKRIDANLMNIDIGEIDDMPDAVYENKKELIRKKCLGVLKIKEYPTGSAHVGHFKVLLKELKQKSKFIPDVIIVDYMNICASARVKNRSDMYTYVKSIAEELRGFFFENNVIGLTATQLNRSGNNSSDVNIKNVSESMGGPATMDFLGAIISTEDLANMGHVLIKQLKNRYSDVFANNTIALGVDRAKMRFFDLTNQPQNLGQQAMPTASSQKQHVPQVPPKTAKPSQPNQIKKGVKV